MLAPALPDQFSTWRARSHALELGMWMFLASEILLFAGLFTLYAGYRALYPTDFAAAIHANTLFFGTVNTYVLLTSSLTVALAVAAVRRERPRWAAPLLALTIAQGVAFLAVKGREYGVHIEEGALPGPLYHWRRLPTFGANRFYTLYWVMTGLHALHVTAGIGVLAFMTGRAARGAYTAERHIALEMGALYWHLVDVIWIFLWPLLYLG